MLPALTGLAGVLVTAAVALVLHRADSRERGEGNKARAAADHQRQHHDERREVWEAIDGLRENQGEHDENLAEIRGLLTGLYAEILGDAGLVEKYRPTKPPAPARRPDGTGWGYPHVRRDDVT